MTNFDVSLGVRLRVVIPSSLLCTGRRPFVACWNAGRGSFADTRLGLALLWTRCAIASEALAAISFPPFHQE